MFKIALGIIAIIGLMAADAGPTAEATICYVYNQHTKHGEWVKCEVHEMLPDGGINPDGGIHR